MIKKKRKKTNRLSAALLQDDRLNGEEQDETEELLKDLRAKAVLTVREPPPIPIK